MPIAKLTNGTKEIDGYAWIITCGNRAYIFSGSKSGLREAMSRVSNEPRNAGSRVRSKLVVN